MFLLCQTVVLLCFQVFLPGYQLIIIECLLLLIGPTHTVHLGAVLQLVLTDVQLLLFHLNLGVSEDILLLCQFSLGVQDLQVQIVVREHQDRVSSADLGSLLNEDFLHDTPFLRAELNGSHGLHTSADADIVIEFPFLCGRDHHSVLIHPKGLVVWSGYQVGDESQEQCSEPVGECLLGECHPPAFYLFNCLIHIFIVLYNLYHCNISLLPV